jgi:hypothetical protein
MAAVDPILEIEAELQKRRDNAAHNAEDFCAPLEDVDPMVCRESREREREREGERERD